MYDNTIPTAVIIQLNFTTSKPLIVITVKIVELAVRKNVFTLNVDLFSRGNAYTTSQLYEEQFGEELSQDSKKTNNYIYESSIYKQI